MKKLFYLLVLTLCLTLGLNAQDDSKVTDCYFPPIPYYPGGDAALLKAVETFVSPYTCDSGRCQAVLKYYVTIDGYIVHDSIKVLRGINPTLDSVAVEAIKSLGRFVPVSGPNVDYKGVWYNIPVRFKRTDRAKQRVLVGQKLVVTGMFCNFAPAVGILFAIGPVISQNIQPHNIIQLLWPER